MYCAERPSLESSLVFVASGKQFRAFNGRQNFLVFVHYKSQRTRINPAQSAPEDTPLGVRGVERTSGGLTLDGKALEYLSQLESTRLKTITKLNLRNHKESH